MKRLMSALLMCVMAIVFCVPAFAVDTATTEQTEPVVFKSNTLPDWFPEDAPAPDPHGEIVTVYWYVDENGNTVTYNPAERKTATGNAGTATIYWVDAHMVTWGITSNAGGAIGIDDFYPGSYAAMMKNRNKRPWYEIPEETDEPEEHKEENIMLLPHFRANFKTGYWEAVFSHTRPLGVVPWDMRG